MTGLRYISWSDHSGYSIAARRNLLALMESGVPVTWTPMVPGGGWGKTFYYHPLQAPLAGDSLLEPICNRDIPYDTVIVHLVPEYFLPWKERLSGKRMIGLTTWETDRLPPHWPAILNEMDEVWVVSTWNREVFVNSGVTVPVRVLPHMFEEPPPSGETDPDLFGIPPDHTVFYSINVWSHRKAMRQLLEVYWKTFTADEPVTLLVKTSQQDLTHPFHNARFPLNRLARTQRTVRRLGRRVPDRASVLLLAEEQVPQQQMDAIHARGDVYVSLSHAEGWGLGAFDAVAARNPVIMTGYGGALDFLDPEHAALLRHRIVQATEPRNPNFEGPPHQWADADVEDARAWMRRLFEDPEQSRSRGEGLRRYARERYHPDKVLQTLLRYLQEEPV